MRGNNNKLVRGLATGMGIIFALGILASIVGLVMLCMALRSCADRRTHPAPPREGAEYANDLYLCDSLQYRDLTFAKSGSFASAAEENGVVKNIIRISSVLYEENGIYFVCSLQGTEGRLFLCRAFYSGGNAEVVAEWASGSTAAEYTPKRLVENRLYLVAPGFRLMVLNLNGATEYLGAENECAVLMADSNAVLMLSMREEGKAGVVRRYDPEKAEARPLAGLAEKLDVFDLELMKDRVILNRQYSVDLTGGNYRELEYPMAKPAEGAPYHLDGVYLSERENKTCFIRYLGNDVYQKIGETVYAPSWSTVYGGRLYYRKNGQIFRMELAAGAAEETVFVLENVDNSAAQMSVKERITAVFLHGSALYLATHADGFMSNGSSYMYRYETQTEKLDYLGELPQVVSDYEYTLVQNEAISALQKMEKVA